MPCTSALTTCSRLSAAWSLAADLSAAARCRKPTHRPFSQALGADPFRLRADVEVGGAVYRPYGTSVRTRVLVVDRAAPNGCGSALEHLEAPVESVWDALDVLAAVHPSDQPPSVEPPAERRGG